MMRKNQNTERLAREYYCRTQSERILDRHLINKDSIVQIQKLESQIHGIEKKIKTDQEQKQISPKEALDTVIKLIGDEKKAPKVFEKIHYLFTNFTQEFHPEEILQVLYLMSNNQCQFKRNEIQKFSLETYNFIRQKDIFNPTLQSLFDILGIELFIHNSLYDDDSFIFNGLIKKLNKILEELSKITLDQVDQLSGRQVQFIVNEETVLQNLSKQKSEQQKTVGQTILNIKEKLQKKNNSQIEEKIIEQTKLQKFPKYEFIFSDDMQKLFQDLNQRIALRQQFIVSCAKDLVQFHKRPWSTTSVTQFLYDLYYNHKMIFSAENQIKIDEIISMIQQQSAALKSKAVNEEVQKAKVMQDYLKPTHDVSDSRAVKIITDNTNIWTSKQSGL